MNCLWIKLKSLIVIPTYANIRHLGVWELTVAVHNFVTCHEVQTLQCPLYCETKYGILGSDCTRGGGYAMPKSR